MRIGESLSRWKKIIWSLKRHENLFRQANRNDAGMLFHRYARVAATMPYRAFLRQHEFQVFSQNGEDGLLLFLFSELGATDRSFVEFGIGNGRQCNTANLAINFGWSGLLMDGKPANVREAQDFYGGLRSCSGNVEVKEAFLTRDNVNQMIADSGITGSIDLVSIDIDGNDYWIWEALEVVRPRVVVIEYNASFGSEHSVTIPYKEDFYRFDAHDSGWYHGASLPALTTLGIRKGYRLVGCDSDGVNAFFVREDLALGRLEPVSAAGAFYPERKRTEIASQREQAKLLSHLPLQEIAETTSEGTDFKS